jgi:hypothetical protein
VEDTLTQLTGDVKQPFVRKKDFESFSRTNGGYFRTGMRVAINARTT